MNTLAIAIKGGSFLIEDRAPADVFTPEDLSEEHLAIARGVQNKVLEAMAMGRPVVASPQAAEGIRAKPGEEIIVADGSAAAACWRERGGTHCDNFFSVWCLQGLDGVSGIDRPFEGVGRNDLQNFRYLRNIQFCGHARQVIFSAGGGGREDGVILAGNR